MRTLIFSIILSLFSLCVMAQSSYTVVDKSERKSPQWLGAMEQGYIVTSAISSDIEEAKRMCLDDVKKHIIDAVAQNVKSSSESSISQTTVNSEIENFLDEFKFSFKTQSATIPYLGNISYINVEGYYWEKRRNRSTKAEEYYYTIRYPFSKEELAKLVVAFKEQDMKMESDLLDIETAFDNIQSVEEIDIAINNLKTLQKYFFDDVRQNRVSASLKNYSSVYGKLSIKRVSDELGDEQYSIMYGDNPISCSKAPRVKANTAFEISTNKNENIWEVKYNYSTCYPDEQNYLDVSWTIGGRSLKDRYYIKLESDITEIKPTGTISLQAEKDEMGEVIALKLSCAVELFYAKQYTIEKIELKNDYLVSPVTFDINYIIDYKGTHTIKATINSGFELSDSKSILGNSLTKGTLIAKNQEGKRISINFDLPTKKNW